MYSQAFTKEELSLRTIHCHLLKVPLQHRLTHLSNYTEAQFDTNISQVPGREEQMPVPRLVADHWSLSRPELCKLAVTFQGLQEEESVLLSAAHVFWACFGEFWCSCDKHSFWVKCEANLHTWLLMKTTSIPREAYCLLSVW